MGKYRISKLILLFSLFFGVSIVCAQSAISTEQVNLIDIYPTTLVEGSTNPDKAYEWEFFSEDIYYLSKFVLEVGDDLKIEMGPSEIGIGHSKDGAVWAIIIPREKGDLYSQSSKKPEKINHLWMRFHPAELNNLIPDKTFSTSNNKALWAWMSKIAQDKMPGSWQSGKKALIPGRKDLSVDVDTTEGVRRFWIVDKKKNTAKYISAFEKQVVPELNTISTDLAEISFDKLWQEYDHEYAMFVLRPDVDWNAIKNQYRPKAICSNTSYEFALICAEMLSHLQYLHIWIKVNGQTVPVFNRVRELNANPNATESIIGKIHKTDSDIRWGITSENIGYIEISAWKDNELVKVFDEILEKMKATQGLIIDVRLNGGGSEPLAQQVAGRFLDNEVVYGLSQYRNGPSHFDLTQKLPRKVKPRGPWKFDKPVIVLIGQKCMSSNESFILMMKQYPSTITMGDHTSGSSGNPRVIDLPIGITVSLPRWIDYLPDSTPLDNVGIQPDIFFQTSKACFLDKQDNLLEKAIKYLSNLPKEKKDIIVDQSNVTQYQNSEVRNLQDNDKELWKTFVTKNSKWLAPSNPSFTYSLSIQERKMDINTNVYAWADFENIDVWCAPEKSLKLFENIFVLGKNRVKMQNYINGQGGNVIPNQSEIKPLRDDLWFGTNIGASFITSLHLFVWWGLPDNTKIVDKDTNTLLLSVSGLSSQNTWRKSSWIRPRYGCHPVVFNGSYELFLDNTEIEIDKQHLRPIRIVEKDKGGKTKALVTFDVWTDLGDQQVPKEIKCYLPGDEIAITYIFEIEKNCWFTKKVEVTSKVESLSVRSILTKLNISDIPVKCFDVSLPENSYTNLKKGERIIKFKTNDGLILEGKLSIPILNKDKYPVVFFLPGAGPWTFDRPIEYPDLSDTNSVILKNKIYNYNDFFAEQLTQRGIAFFRINKRGCALVDYEPYEVVNRHIFSQATLDILLRDYKVALDELRKQADIDEQKIVLLCGSEGTIIGPRLKLNSPEGILSIIMFGYAEDNTKDIIKWQNTVGPWRNISRIFDEDENGKITENEHGGIFKKIPTPLAMDLSFKRLDKDNNGIIEPRDVENKEALEKILKAISKRDDDFLWVNLLNLTSAYLIEDWDRPPNHQNLLKLDIPLAIFHGENDGACRVEGVLEAQKAFEDANKNNLFVQLYPKTDHDLNWMKFLREEKVPKAYVDIFNYIENVINQSHSGR